MRSSLTKLSLLALLVTGCERMPEDPVFIYGRVLHADGAPAAGSPLKMERALDTRSDLSGIPEEVEGRTWDYAPYSAGTSEASGYFTLEALAGDLYTERYFSEGYYGYLQHRFRVAPPLAEDGHGVFVAFFLEDDVELPPLQQWASGFSVGDGPEGPRLTFAPAPPAPTLPPSASLPESYDNEGMSTEQVPPSTPAPVVQLHAADGVVWQQLHAASPWVPSPYVLEDFSGVEAQVRAASVGQWYFEPLGAQFSQLTFRLEWRSPRLALPAGGLRPLSRGATCSPLPAPGPCPFTDGKAAAVETRPGSTQPGPGNPEGFGVEALTFTLDAPVRPRRVVVRGLETTLNYVPRVKVVLEGSLDGATWTPLESLTFVNFDPEDRGRQIYQYSLVDTDADSPFDGPMELFTPPVFLDAPLTGEASVRHVRLSVRTEDMQFAGRLWKLGEVSLFE
ncbi:hypothetical protein [Pyxidicoccus trucidator]|uniref:hypothetical protein n=1 Tax=Pyxidicoccus trucidator TaxID=2709662 RepID=UPI0013D8F39D|nr:hypothetical protein [Pyxidicoccus trucidator]